MPGLLRTNACVPVKEEQVPEWISFLDLAQHPGKVLGRNGIVTPFRLRLLDVADGIVREGDGTMTVWIASDRHHFTKRSVKVGLQHAGYDQILEGVRPGEQIVTKGAIFLDVLAGGGDS